MKRTCVLLFLVLPALALAQHQSISLDLITPLTLYPAFGNPNQSAGGVQFEGVAVEWLYFVTDTIGVGLMLGGGFFSPEQVYPYAGGFVLPISVCGQLTVMETEYLRVPVLVRAGILPSFRDIFSSAGPTVNAYFQGNVMAGIVFKEISLRLLIGAATIDFQVLGVRLEAGFTWRMEGVLSRSR